MYIIYFYDDSDRGRFLPDFFIPEEFSTGDYTRNKSDAKRFPTLREAKDWLYNRNYQGEWVPVEENRALPRSRTEFEILLRDKQQA